MRKVLITLFSNIYHLKETYRLIHSILCSELHIFVNLGHLKFDSDYGKYRVLAIFFEKDNQNV